MTNLNKALLIGRLGKDPEVRYTKAGGAVANFSVATTSTWKDGQGQKQEATEWHDIVAWGQKADFANDYLKKGMLIYVEGRLQTTDWTDKENVKRYKTEIVANDIKFMEKRSDAQEATNTAPPMTADAQSQYPSDLDDIPF